MAFNLSIMIILFLKNGTEGIIHQVVGENLVLQDVLYSAQLTPSEGNTRCPLLTPLDLIAPNKNKKEDS